MNPRLKYVAEGAPGIADVSLAPLYDLASAQLRKTQIPTEKLPFAMSVGGLRTLGEINRAAWESQAHQLRLDAARAISEIDDLLGRVVGGAKQVAESGIERGVDAVFAARFARRIRSRAVGCAKELSWR